LRRAEQFEEEEKMPYCVCDIAMLKAVFPWSRERCKGRE
jgi:hypothetical protein